MNIPRAYIYNAYTHTRKLLPRWVLQSAVPLIALFFRDADDPLLELAAAVGMMQSDEVLASMTSCHQKVSSFSQIFTLPPAIARVLLNTHASVGMSRVSS